MRFIRLLSICICMAFVLDRQVCSAQTLPIAKISSWEQSANGTGVTFKPLNPAAVDADGIPDFPDQTANGTFEYSVKADDLKWAEDCRCFRYYTVTVRSRDGRVSRHKFRAYPNGSFEDQRVKLRLTITQGNITDSDDISLPIASAPGAEPYPLITVTTRDSMAFVSLGGTSEIQLILRNPNKQMVIQVPSEIQVTSDTGRLWKSTPSAEDRPYPIRLEPGATEVVRLQVEPNAREAIAASFKPTTNDKPHTGLRIKVRYSNPTFQSREGIYELELPVRFRPNIWTLGGFLAIGVSLGSLVLFLSRKVVSPKRLPHAVLTALAVATILELVGMFMVAHDSKFVVFTFDLDPWQTLPVLLLGIGNGLLGFEAARQLRFIKEEQK